MIIYITKFEKKTIKVPYQKEEHTFEIFIHKIEQLILLQLKDPQLAPYFQWDARHMYKWNVSRLHPIFCFSLSFSCQRLLPQCHIHGCHMDAMLKLCDHLAAPIALVLQARSPGIWLPTLFGRSFTCNTFSIKVM
jgi:hypothetical protein